MRRLEICTSLPVRTPETIHDLGNFSWIHLLDVTVLGSTPSKIALEMLNPEKSRQSVPLKLHLRKFIGNRVPNAQISTESSCVRHFRFAFDRSAPVRSQLVKSALNRSAMERFALDRFAASKSQPERFNPEKFTPERFAFLRLKITPGNNISECSRLSSSKLQATIVCRYCSSNVAMWRMWTNRTDEALQSLELLQSQWHGLVEWEVQHYLSNTMKIIEQLVNFLLNGIFYQQATWFKLVEANRQLKRTLRHIYSTAK